jgi:hypothetical protein
VEVNTVLSILGEVMILVKPWATILQQLVRKCSGVHYGGCQEISSHLRADDDNERLVTEAQNTEQVPCRLPEICCSVLPKKKTKN